MPIVLDGTQGISTPMYAGSISSNPVTPSVNMKNRIINGNCVIDQRNAGASVTPTGGQYTLDRWRSALSQTGKYSVQQSSTAPVGFTNSALITSLSAYSVGASDNFRFEQFVEGFNSSDLGWGTANAKTVTLSFWVRSSLTGTFGGAFLNSAENRSYPFTYTISSANTFEYKTVTIVGDTSGTWLTNNGIGIRVSFSLGAGSTVSGTAGSWSGNFYTSATGATSVVGTNGATFYITGVQLEVGSTATSFDYRPYTTELQLCQRYFWRSTQNGTNAGLGFAIGTAAATFSRAQIALPVQMRAVPTAVFSSVSVFNSATGLVNITLVDSYSTINLISVDGTASGTTSPSGGSLLVYLNGASAFASASAEL